MPRSLRAAVLATLLLIPISLAPPAAAQGGGALVETILPAGSDIDDALTIGPDGALYGSRFGEFGNRHGTTVTRLDLRDGTTSVYADGFVNANGTDFDDSGAMFALSYTDRRVERIDPDGTQTTFATAPAGRLSGLLIHPETGVIYITDPVLNTVQVLNPDGTFSPFLANDGTSPRLNGPVGMAVDDAGRLYVSNFSDGKILRVEADSSLTEIADLAGPAGFTTGFITYAAGSLFATGIGTHVVEEVSLADGSVRVLAGTGTAGQVDGPAAEARFNGPNGIVATPSGDTLYVSDINARSVRRIIRSQGTAGEAAPEAAARLAALGAAPNPSRGAVALRYRLPRAAHVRIAVYDLLGRLVGTAEDARRPAGEHVARFEAGALAPGLYLYRVEAGGEVATGRLTRY